jgi:hypothetical protein
VREEEYNTSFESFVKGVAFGRAQCDGSSAKVSESAEKVESGGSLDDPLPTIVEWNSTAKLIHEFDGMRRGRCVHIAGRQVEVVLV